ncbi:MAG: hypothetical protein HN478_09990 [Rhodospirillaceae bacterium]|jgi:hypothetical protein|nr:hypothetical protein [Rhodospirillaceae bacterium]MBT4491238.1 hypothetical protein [Rhodospirillaceae bacterium]MBT4690682.1 hypothetical protein [Rhodospirillaceae bacterium]MBT5194254.1 hypothetical protein [Rhodospirillaceae bacterium]MBT6429582.1 hypothetical protein [Rhodospirillaceae bacterium]
MAAKPKTKTDTKTTKAETTATKSEAPKTEASKTDTSDASSATDSSSDSGSDGGSSGSSGGSKSSSDRPISYFSSVSTDDYRSGWDGVFGNNGSGAKKAKPRKPAKRAAKPASQLPMTINLDADELAPELRDELEAVFRKQVKKKRLNYDKLSGNGQVSLQISCRISGG